MAANATEINETYLTNAANAIRTKKGTTGTIKAVEFPSQILSINTGSSASGTINITTNGTHDVSSYASANVNVPSGGESKLEWTINNTIPHTFYECSPKLADSAYTGTSNELENNYKIYAFNNQLEIYLYPLWGYRFKYDETNSSNIQITETNSQIIGYYNPNRIYENKISNNFYIASWGSDNEFRIYSTSGLYSSSPFTDSNSTETVTISGTAEIEPIPSLTTFDTTGLTKQWTGTLTYSNGTLATDNTFPYWNISINNGSSMLTTSLTLKFRDLFRDHDSSSYSNINFNDEPFVGNRLACPQTTGVCLQFANPMYYTGADNSNECYIQIGNIFIHFIPSGNESSRLFIPENCAIETLIEYLQANLVNDGDSIPIYKWVSGSN